jgi:hypothetical protein
MTLLAIDGCVRAGQDERSRGVFKRGGTPTAQRMALGALLGEAGGSMIRLPGAVVVAAMAARALSRSVLIRSGRVALLATQNSVRAGEQCQ